MCKNQCNQERDQAKELVSRLKAMEAYAKEQANKWFSLGNTRAYLKGAALGYKQAGEFVKTAFDLE